MAVVYVRVRAREEYIRRLDILVLSIMYNIMNKFKVWIRDKDHGTEANCSGDYGNQTYRTHSQPRSRGRVITGRFGLHCGDHCSY